MEYDGDNLKVVKIPVIANSKKTWEEIDGLLRNGYTIKASVNFGGQVVILEKKA